MSIIIFNRRVPDGKYSILAVGSPTSRQNRSELGNISSDGQNKSFQISKYKLKYLESI